MIIEDEHLAIKVLENHLSHFDDLELISVCNNPMEALSVIQKESIDILFLDIQTPQMTGLQFLKTLSKKPIVILTTAHREYAIESYELEVLDYLLKPISLERFTQSIAKAFRLRKQEIASLPNSATYGEEPQPEENAFVYVKSEREFVKVNLAKIICIESIKNHIRISTDTGSIITLISISDIEERLPKSRFCRIHRSYIVALNRIDRFTQQNVTIGQSSFPIGRHYKLNFQQRMDGFIF